MTIASSHRLIQFALSVVVIAGAGCNSFVTPARLNQTLPDRLAGVTARVPDAFYDPPAQVSAKPGTLLRSEALRQVTLPAGMRAWRILYTTTADDKTPLIAIAIVLAPVNPPAGPRPLILWKHRTTGVLQKCMPSLLSNPTIGIPALDWIVKAGWVIVATDYGFAEKDGPHPYLIGEGQARSGLDSVRAARQMKEFSLDARTVVWGHSQGGHAALWTGIIGRRYAPDVEIVGVAAIAPAANLTKILSISPPIEKGIGPYLALSYSRFYPDITFEQALRPEALNAAREMVVLCSLLPLEDPQRLAELSVTFDGPALATSTNAALAARLKQNAPDQPIAAPVLVTQGLADVVVPPQATKAYMDERCAAGQRLEYWTFAGIDHTRIVHPGSPMEGPLIAWTSARFANEPQASGCTGRAS